MKLKKLALAAEVVASLGVIITLVLLLLEIRMNTLTMQRQMEMAHYELLFTPYVEPSILMSALTKIKAVDGTEADVAAFMSNYDLSQAEAIAWSRSQLLIWLGMQQSFLYDGPSDELAAEIRQLNQYPDVRLFLKHQPLAKEFRAYVDFVNTNPESP